MIFDAHTHIFNENVYNNRTEYLTDENFSHLYNDKKSRLVNHAQLSAVMEESGVDYAVALGFAWKNKKFCEEQNEYFSKVHNLTDGKLLPFGSVPLDEVDDIEGWVKDIKDKGLFGIGEIGFYIGGMKEDYIIYLRKVLEGAKKYSLPVSLHVNEPVGHKYTGKYNPDFPELYTILEEFSDVVIIFAHWGGGLLFYELMPEINKKFKNFYYDTAASPYLYKNDIYKIAARILGSEKILFGSDYPLLKFSRYTDAIRDSGLDSEDVHNILGMNCAGIFGLK